MSNQKPVKVVHLSFHNGEMHVIDDQGRLWRSQYLTTWKLVQLPTEPEEVEREIK